MNISLLSRAGDRRLLLTASIGILAIVFAGFARTYYLRSVQTQTWMQFARRLVS